MSATQTNERHDFFLSRRGSVAAVAQEVRNVLTDRGYKVLVQDYDTQISGSFVEMMHEAVKNSRDLVILFTLDYEQSPYTRKEFTSFEAERAQSTEQRHIIVLRCEDAPLRGLLADNIYQDLVGITDREERKRRIIAAAERQSPAAAAPPRPFLGAPPRLASFTGRAEELDSLDAILMRDKPAAVTQSIGRAAVQGLGGVGKTSLATEYAHRYRQLYAGVCWCPAETRQGLLSSLAGLAVILGAAAENEGNVEKAAKAALRRLSEQRATWLLVYDNVTSPDEITDLLPADGARVLITSRFSDWSALADEVSLDVLPLEEAVACLETRTGRHDAEGARTLAEALGCLPLALDHAAAYCKRTQIGFADYGAEAARLIAAAPRGANYPKSVAATFDLAISQAASQCPSAEMLMAFLAQCAPERIPTSIMGGASRSEDERRQALAALAEVSLLKYDRFNDGTQAITVHRLVQQTARVRARARGLDEFASRSLIARFMEVYPTDAWTNPQSWSCCLQMTPHLLAVHDALGVKSSDALERSMLLRRASAYLMARGSVSEAELLTRQALTITEEMLGGEHPETLTNLGKLASLVHYRQDYELAGTLYKRALNLCEKLTGAEHPRTAWYAASLGELLRDQGDYPAASRLLERALAIYEKKGTPNNATASLVRSLAETHEAQGNLTAARRLRQRHPGAATENTDVRRGATIYTCYSRGDLAFVDKLEEALKARGFEPLIDRTDIFAFEEWWKRIETLIFRADTVVFVLSPDSAKSQIALREVSFAMSLNKRLVPIVCRPVEREAVPYELANMDCILFSDSKSFGQDADRLAEALAAHIGWIKQHTEMGDLAQRWASARRPKGLLLRSPSLEQAERWSAARPEGAPPLTAEMQAFIRASREGNARRRNALALSLAVALLLVAGTGLAYWLTR